MSHNSFESILIAALIMALMLPLIFMFRYLPRWGAAGYRWAAGFTGLGAAGLLHFAAQGNFGALPLAWAGILGGLLAWTLAELSHEMGLANIESPEIIPMLALSLAAFAVLWQFLPQGARFWGAVFALNWSGHVFIRLCQQAFPRRVTARIFAVTAAGFGALMLALIALPFAHPLTSIQHLWNATGIWFSSAMIFFLTLYPNRLDPEPL